MDLLIGLPTLITLSTIDKINNKKFKLYGGSKKRNLQQINQVVNLLQLNLILNLLQLNLILNLLQLNLILNLLLLNHLVINLLVINLLVINLLLINLLLINLLVLLIPIQIILIKLAVEQKEDVVILNKALLVINQDLLMLFMYIKNHGDQVFLAFLECLVNYLQKLQIPYNIFY